MSNSQRIGSISNVLRDVHARKTESLAEYYIRNCAHLIPAGVSIIEFDEISGSAKQF